MQEINITQQLEDTNRIFRNIFSSISEEQMNTVPFTGSWTPAQVAQHVFKAEAGMLKALAASANETDRDAFAAVPQLKQIFLDFTTKLKSPEMAVPEQKEYDKKELLQRLDNVAAKLTAAIPYINNKELVTGLPAGDLTKGEIIHFLLYHTERHIYQLQNIAQTLTNKTKPMMAIDEIIRNVNEAFSKNDIEAFLSYCTDDITWDMISEMTTTGKENIRKMMTEIPGEPPGMTISDVFSTEDKGVCTGTFSMKKKSGEPGNYYFCDVYYFKDNKIQKMDSYVVEMKQ